MRIRLSETESVDDPFDAIYLSELKRDDVSSMDIEKIIKFSNIKDLSDTINFSDEWELIGLNE